MMLEVEWWNFSKEAKTGKVWSCSGNVLFNNLGVWKLMGNLMKLESGGQKGELLGSTTHHQLQEELPFTDPNGRIIKKRHQSQIPTEEDEYCISDKKSTNWETANETLWTVTFLQHTFTQNKPSHLPPFSLLNKFPLLGLLGLPVVFVMSCLSQIVILCYFQINPFFTSQVTSFYF